MNPMLWRTFSGSHIPPWVVIVAGMLVGAMCVWLANQILGKLDRLLTGIFFLAPIILYLGVSTFRARALRESQQEIFVIALDQFLATPEATFAPNYPELSQSIREWAASFALQHGQGSVFVGIQQGEEHLCDVVYLSAPTLTAGDRKALGALGIAGLRQLASTSLPKALQQTKPASQNIYEVVWD